MSQANPPETSALIASFSEHIQAFHRTLPTDEQEMLERVFAMAEAAVTQGDTQGYDFNNLFSLYGGVNFDQLVQSNSVTFAAGGLQRRTFNFGSADQLRPE